VPTKKIHGIDVQIAIRPAIHIIQVACLTVEPSCRTSSITSFAF
jgi:hypothetical protein